MTAKDADRFHAAPESITTVIDKGVHIEGTIKVDSGKSLLIKGEFTGKLESNGVVIVSQGAVCTGSISANKLRVAGTIRKAADGEASSVVAKDGLLVERTGRLETDELSYSDIELQFGAKISGSMVPLGGVDAPAEEAEEVAPAPVAAAPAEPAPAPAPAAAHTVSTVVPMPGVPTSLLVNRLNLDEPSDFGSSHYPQRAGGGF